VCSSDLGKPSALSSSVSMYHHFFVEDLPDPMIIL